ncbi:threonyl-tRNA synthetase [Lithohypha guttulata]|nr:threonyl-tRNA synthetase [Lithohypha guttulata]
MSHKKSAPSLGLRPHNLWGTLQGEKMTQQNGDHAAAPESQTHGLKGQTITAVQGNKMATGKKDMSDQAAPASQAGKEGLPDFIVERNRLFDELKKKYDDELAAKEKTPIKIRFTPEPGTIKEIEGNAWDTTPGKLLKDVPKERAAKIVVARVDGKEWDLDRPLEKDCSLGYYTFDDKEGRYVFWHSSAHVLGECAEHQYGCRLSHGPPTDMGFFYDMALEPGRAVTESDWPSLEAKAKKFTTKDKQPFVRLEVGKDDLLKMFGYSKYKTHYINQLVKDDKSTVYRNGDLVDLCQGPHIQNTRKIESFKIMKNSSAYFLGDQANDSLQRIHAVSFPNKQGLKEWEHMLEEAKKRNHQLIGKQQKLFFFSQQSPGSPFLLPHGTRIFNALQSMLRDEYWNRGYQEVQSPNMYNVNLWKTSGHWQHYQDDMFRVIVNDETSEPPQPMPLSDQKPSGAPVADIKNDDKDKGVFALKPMNCPGHCLLFRDEERSYRELPWRIADFGVLHRNEASGALSGLTRVRKFQQDDTHIFCTKDQIMGEIKGLFDFMNSVYSLFGFPFKLKLSTRPEGFMGKIEEWDAAEAQLKQALQDFRGDDWELNPGDGAFYGPKIDITISDALRREYQCATIQLDFQGPQNFKLEYRTGEASQETDKEVSAKEREKDPNALTTGMARPVMIHRAIVGSFERFIAILCEHFAGKWPFWLSPRQIMIIPVMRGAEGYVRELQQIFHKAKMYVDVDLSGNTLPKKIRNAQIEQYNFTFVVGAQEQETRTVNIRNRDDPATQKQGQLVPLDKALAQLIELRDNRVLESKIDLSE